MTANDRYRRPWSILRAGAGRPRRSPAPSDAERRLARLEAAVAALSLEVRTRRLVVCDSSGAERIVGEVVDGQTELRLSCGDQASQTAGSDGWHPARPARPEPTITTFSAAWTTAPTPRPARARGLPTVIVFACPGRDGLGPLAGLQVWGNGDVAAALEAWHDGCEPWQATLRLADTPEGTAPGP